MLSQGVPDPFEQHPCFNKRAARRFARIHLPVAASCNVKCRYCNRKCDCANENRPGVASRLLSPVEATARLSEAVEKDPRIRVVGIAGPGDPLADAATLKTLKLINKRYPHLIKCISTNGLLLEKYVPLLKRLGVKAVTVTVNAVDPAAGAQIYEYVLWHHSYYRGEEAAALLWNRQAAGILKAVRAGLRIKVNTVLIPGVNDKHCPAVAQSVAKLGVFMMNIMPLIPQAGFAHLKPPTPLDLSYVRAACEQYLPQMNWCRQCRADASGLLNETREYECRFRR